jgi:creatinine amidohydrolase/Fe(II)-dependent formamide hydrolase-like protein/7-cyano-7-deazaguanine synthase in queuosine biosynthesis
MATKNIRDLVVLETLTVGPPIITRESVKARYVVRDFEGKVSSSELVYSYGEDVFDPEDPFSQNLASVMMAQVAMNYGLFFREIIFDGLYDNPDKRFILDMTENTSREIFVNKFLTENVFLQPGAQEMNAEPLKRYTAARIVFKNTSQHQTVLNWSHRETDRRVHVVLSSGGKDSLLSYGLLKELNREVHPVFVNESGRHWFTAINSYRYLKSTDKNTARVWSNCDRVFNWMLRQLSFIRPDFQSIRADYYPVRLWTVAVFIFGVMPVAIKRKAARLIIGNEYDTSIKSNHQGITHYSSLYDQSRYFDQALSRYYMKKGWSISQFSILRPLSEMLIIKTLVKRYPELQNNQVSCHSAHEKEGRIFPCGHCEKCRRIVGMLSVLDEDPKRCGYNDVQIRECLSQLESKKVKQIGSDASHLFYLLLKKNLIKPGEHTLKMARAYPRIMQLRFDKERSQLTDIPFDLRAPLLKIFLNYADGAVSLKKQHWQDFDVLHSPDLNHPYPFEMLMQRSNPPGNTHGLKKDYLWATLSWPEVESRLKKVDIALLPCGSIEQHGPHLPVDVDHFDAEYLAIKVAEACSDPRPFVLPPVPYGVSYHHEDFPGTISISNEGLYTFIYEIGMSLARNGIKKLIIINGHGDNAPTLNFAAQMINRDARIFVAVDSGETSDADIHLLTESENDIHAGEIETSTTLAVRPWMVDMEKAEDTDVSFDSDYLNFGSSRGLPWYVRTKKISQNGVMGRPTKASEEKGKKIWEVMIAHLVNFVEEIKASKLEDLFQKKY